MPRFVPTGLIRRGNSLDWQKLSRNQLRLRVFTLLDVEEFQHQGAINWDIPTLIVQYGELQRKYEESYNFYASPAPAWVNWPDPEQYRKLLEAPIPTTIGKYREWIINNNIPSLESLAWGMPFHNWTGRSEKYYTVRVQSAQALLFKPASSQQKYQEEEKKYRVITINNNNYYQHVDVVIPCYLTRGDEIFLKQFGVFDEMAAKTQYGLTGYTLGMISQASDAARIAFASANGLKKIEKGVIAWLLHSVHMSAVVTDAVEKGVMINPVTKKELDMSIEAQLNSIQSGKETISTMFYYLLDFVGVKFYSGHNHLPYGKINDLRIKSGAALMANPLIEYKLNPNATNLCELFIAPTPVIKDSCFVTAIYETFREGFNKSHTQMPLTPDLVFDVCVNNVGTLRKKRKRPLVINDEREFNTEGGNYLTLEEAKRWFVENGLFLDVRDQLGHPIPEACYRPTKEAENHNWGKKGMMAVLVGDHIYPVTDVAEKNKVCQKQSAEILPYVGDKYPELPKDESTLVEVTDEESLVKYIIADKGQERVEFIVDLNLRDIAYCLFKHANYIPMVSIDKNALTRVIIRANNKDYTIRHFYPNAHGEQIIFDPATAPKFGELMKLWYQTLLDDKYKSHYSDTAKHLIQHYFPSNRVGLFVERDEEEHGIIGIDSNKAYSSFLYQLRKFPVLSSLDEVTEYNGEDVEDTTFYILEAPEILASDPRIIVAQRNLYIVSGYILKEMLATSENWGPIRYYLKPSIVEDVNFSDIMDNIVQQLPEGFKSIFNSSVGMAGKKYNRKSRTFSFRNGDDANFWYYRITCQHPEVEEAYVDSSLDPLHFLVVSKKTPLSEGFMPLHMLIMSWNNWQMYKRAVWLRQNNFALIGMNTDSLFIDAKEEERVKPLVEEYNKHKTDPVLGSEVSNFCPKWGGGVKIEHKARFALRKLLRQSKVDVDVFLCREDLAGGIGMITQTFTEEEENEADSHSIIDHYLYEPGLKTPHTLLIIGKYPGVGKTTLALKIAKKTASSVLVVCPTNSLARDIRKKGFQAVTFHKLLGMGIDGVEKSPMDLTDYKCIVFDEVFAYPTSIQARINRIERENPDIRFIEVGDWFQLQPIESTPLSNLTQSERATYYKNAVFNRADAIYELQVSHRNTKDNLRDIFSDLFEQKLSALAVARKYKLKTVTEADLAPAAMVYTRNTCHELNKLLQKKKSHTGAPLFTSNQINYYAGDTVVCRVAFRDSANTIQLFTNYTYEVLSFKDNTVTIRDVDGEEHFKLPLERFNNHLIINHAFTVHTTQGITFEGAVTLAELEKEHLADAFWFWTAITRVKSLELLSVLDKTPIPSEDRRPCYSSEVQKQSKSCRKKKHKKKGGPVQ